jgi:hypothetical protein
VVAAGGGSSCYAAAAATCLDKWAQKQQRQQQEGEEQEGAPSSTQARLSAWLSGLCASELSGLQLVLSSEAHDRSLARGHT